jgi:hypothetical protein
MSRRGKLIDILQALAVEEAGEQPSAADWLLDQDSRAQARRDRNPGRAEDHDY